MGAVFQPLPSGARFRLDARRGDSQAWGQYSSRFHPALSKQIGAHSKTPPRTQGSAVITVHDAL